MPGVTLNPVVGCAPVGGPGVGWLGVTTRLAHASKEEQRGQHVPGLLNGVHSDVIHQVSRVVVNQACIHGLDQRKLSDQPLDLG